MIQVLYEFTYSCIDTSVWPKIDDNSMYNRLYVSKLTLAMEFTLAPPFIRVLMISWLPQWTAGKSAVDPSYK